MYYNRENTVLPSPDPSPRVLGQLHGYLLNSTFQKLNAVFIHTHPPDASPSCVIPFIFFPAPQPLADQGILLLNGLDGNKIYSIQN